MAPDSFDDTWETLVRKLQHNHPFLESLTVALSLQRFSPLWLDSLRSKKVVSLQRNCLLDNIVFLWIFSCPLVYLLGISAVRFVDFVARSGAIG